MVAITTIIAVITTVTTTATTTIITTAAAALTTITATATTIAITTIPIAAGTAITAIASTTITATISIAITTTTIITTTTTIVLRLPQLLLLLLLLPLLLLLSLLLLLRPPFFSLPLFGSGPRHSDLDFGDSFLNFPCHRHSLPHIRSPSWGAAAPPQPGPLSFLPGTRVLVRSPRVPRSAALPAGTLSRVVLSKFRPSFPVTPGTFRSVSGRQVHDQQPAALSGTQETALSPSPCGLIREAGGLCPCPSGDTGREAPPSRGAAGVVCGCHQVTSGGMETLSAPLPLAGLGTGGWADVSRCGGERGS